MKPLIGMNMDISAGPPRKIWAYATYHEAIIANGGIPIFLAPVTEHDIKCIVDRLDGLVLIGGDDYSPQLYGESAHPSVELIDPERESFDFALMNYIRDKKELPVLGLCNGAQLMNIAFGGSLVQDICSEMPNSKVKHKGEAGWKVKDWHEVVFEAGSRLKDIYQKERLNVPTAHHQGIKTLGKGLKSAARTDDGWIEALEAPEYRFAIGVQWHPERDLIGNEPLFKAFLAAAKVAHGVR